MGSIIGAKPHSLPLAERPLRVVVVAGPPAAGKGTICDGVKKRYGLVHISSGQILRDQVQSGTALGRCVKPFVDSGQLAPSELVIEIVKERLRHPDVIDRGCLLDNFPITADQAKIMTRQIYVDQFIFLDVPHDILIERSIGRHLDPLTGRIYHSKFRPPPPEVLTRLVQRSDDRESLVQERLDTYNRHIKSIVPLFRDRVTKIDGTGSPDAVLDAVAGSLDLLEWTRPDAPYFGNVAFNGPFSSDGAKRAGFFSPIDPPEIGEHVVCFRRGSDWQKRGLVSEVTEEVSKGTYGLRRGSDGVKVTVSLERGGGWFQSWAAFLAPVNDMEYSSICTTHALLSSNFAKLYSCSAGIRDVDPISPEAARGALVKWLQNLEDADGEAVDIAPALQEELVAQLDKHSDASLYLYTTHHKLGSRTSLTMGLDYSVYYRALNNTLNCDALGNLSNAMPIIERMIYLLLYDEGTGTRRFHHGARVWKGDAQRPVPLNMHKLGEANRLHKVVRFRQFQSTTTDESLADKYLRREDGRGYKWIIDIPAGFWGARDIQNISWKANESETLFPPYSAFRVESVDADCCHLVAVDRNIELNARAERHGLRGSPVELLGY